MSALIAALFFTLPLQVVTADLGADAEATPAAGEIVTPDSPVITRTQQRRPSGQRPRGKRPQRPRQQPKNGFLELFWNIFPPPGAYTMEVGLSVGANYLETAFGGINPNVIFRGQFSLRPMPRRAPLFVYGLVDYTDYKQIAGELEYISRYATLGAGGGLLGWVGPLRLDLGAEVGALVRASTQTDGQSDPITRYNVQPSLGLIAGGGLAILGHVSLSLRGAVRTYSGIPARVDYSVLYGLEWIIDARPVDYY